MSWLFRQKIQHRRLEDLVTHGKHVVAAGDVEGTPARQQGGELLRRTREPVLGSNRDQHWSSDCADLLTGEVLARAADACRERLEIGFGLLGKSAKHPRRRIVYVGGRGRLEGCRDALGLSAAV